MAGRRDISPVESVELLRIALRAMVAVSKDLRPEVRNSGVRTLFLAISCNGRKFGSEMWSKVLGEVRESVLRHTHHMACTSSDEVLAASELGKGKGGRSVMMLMHHSRNTEQKQWEETLVLVLAGVTKVLRAFLPDLLPLPGFREMWEDLMEVVRAVLAQGRKTLASAATNLITVIVLAHGPPGSTGSTACAPFIGTASTLLDSDDLPSMGPPGSGAGGFGASGAAASPLQAPPGGGSGALAPWMWRGAMQAVEAGVRTMAAPHTPVPLQARTDLASCIATMYCTLREQLSGDDVRTVLRWLGRFARYPVGLEDAAGASALATSGQLSPVQKIILSAITGLAPLPTPDAWMDALSLLCGTLCPLRLAPYRQAGGTAAGQQQGGWQQGLGQQGGWQQAGVQGGAGGAAGEEEAVDLAVEARSLTSTWMVRAAAQVAVWYKDHVPWQVRVAAFPMMVSSLAECMALRHFDPNPVQGPGTAAAPQPQQQQQQQQQQGPGTPGQGLGPQISAGAAGLFGGAGSGGGGAGGVGGERELWRTAARAFVTVVQSGLPSINITAQGQQQMQALPGGASSPFAASSSALVPPETWPVLCRAFETFLLAQHLPAPLQPSSAPSSSSFSPFFGVPAAAAAAAANSQQQQGLQLRSGTLGLTTDGGSYPRTSLLLSSSPSGLSPQPSITQSSHLASEPSLSLSTPLIIGAAVSAATAGTSSPPSAAAAAAAAATTAAAAAASAAASADFEVLAAVLDCLTDTVLNSCQFAPTETRAALVRVIDLGTRSTPLSSPQLQLQQAQGAAGPSAQSAVVQAHARFPHLCLSKLYVLCSRGQDSEPREQSVRCQLEVAQLALPVFIARCDAILRRYAAEDRHGALSGQAVQQQYGRGPYFGSGAGAVPQGEGGAAGGSPPRASLDLLTGGSVWGPGGTGEAQAVLLAALTEKARLVMDLLHQLRVAPAVADAAVAAAGTGGGAARWPHLRPWLDVVRARSRKAAAAAAATGVGVPLSRASSASSSVSAGLDHSAGGGVPAAPRPKESTHLLALYGALCECAACRDVAVREAAAALLLQVGRDVGLLPDLQPPHQLAASGGSSGGGVAATGAASVALEDA